MFKLSILFKNFSNFCTCSNKQYFSEILKSIFTLYFLYVDLGIIIICK